MLAFCWSEGLTNTPAHTSAGYASVERIGRGTPDLHSHPPAFRRARSARVLNVGGNVQVINILKNAECAKDTTCLKAIFSDEYGFMRCQTSISMFCKFLGVASNAANLSCGQQLVGRIGRSGAPALKTPEGRARKKRSEDCATIIPPQTCSTGVRRFGPPILQVLLEGRTAGRSQ